MDIATICRVDVTIGVTRKLWTQALSARIDAGFPIYLAELYPTHLRPEIAGARGVLTEGFRKILLINGHKMTNLAALTSAARNFREFDRSDVLVAVADPMYLARGIAGKLKGANEHHAGELEVSHVYYKFPETIKPERFSAARCDFPGVFGPFGTDDLFGGGRDSIEQPWTSAEQRVIAPQGQFSSNAGATKEKGKAYHDYMVARLVEFLGWWERYEGPLGSVAHD